MIRLERAARAAALAASPFRSARSRSLPGHGASCSRHRPRPGRHLPAALRRRFIGRRRLDGRRSSRRRRSSSPGLAAAVAFRMQLWNIGAEGQLYFGAIGAPASRSGSGRTGRRRSRSWRWPSAARPAARAWALIPACSGCARTNEIITTLMLNYVAGLLLTYLIFDSASSWRDLSTVQARSFPQASPAADEPFWPTSTLGVAVRSAS